MSYTDINYPNYPALHMCSEGSSDIFCTCINLQIVFLKILHFQKSTPGEFNSLQYSLAASWPLPILLLWHLSKGSGGETQTLASLNHTPMVARDMPTQGSLL